MLLRVGYVILFPLSYFSFIPLLTEQERLKSTNPLWNATAFEKYNFDGSRGHLIALLNHTFR